MVFAQAPIYTISMSRRLFKAMNVFLIALCLGNVATGMRDGAQEEAGTSDETISAHFSSVTQAEGDALLGQPSEATSDHMAFHDCHLGHCACVMTVEPVLFQVPGIVGSLQVASDTPESVPPSSRLRPPALA